MALIHDIENNFQNLDKFKLTINQNNFDVFFSYLDNNYSLLVDKDLKYLYLNSSSVNTDLMNADLAFDLNMKNVLKLIKNNSKKFVNDYKSPKDEYGIFRETKTLDKTECNYENIKSALESSTLSSELSIGNIPKNIIYSRKQIIDIIINEVRSVNNNRSFLHYIIPSDLDYTFNINLILNNSSGIEINIVLEIKFDPDLHPFYPPKIQFLRPSAKKEFIYHISNLSLFKVENWNPIINLTWLVENLAVAIKPLLDDYILDNDEEISQLEKDLVILSSLLGENPYEYVKIDLNHNKSSLKESSRKGNEYWVSGVGYGNSARENKWDISSYIKEKSNKNFLISEKIVNITKEINEENFLFLESSPILKYISSIIENSTLLEINDDQAIFINILKIIDKILKIKIIEDWTIEVYFGLSKIRGDINPLINSVEDSSKLTNFIEIITISDQIIEFIEESNILNKVLPKYNLKEEKELNLQEKYKLLVKEEQENLFSGYEINSSHLFFKNKTDKLGPKQITRISSEFSSIRRNLPNNWDSSIIVKSSVDNMNVFSFIISGPKDTPYHNGIYEFHACFPMTYPDTEPKVLLNTTGNGTVRFNPNLYDCGKVCLSLLGTWKGQDGESWNKKTSTFLQVLISIQSLILVEEPYFNEPGWEREMHTPAGRKKSFDYNDNIRYNNLKWAILDSIENPPKGYEDFTRKHFEIKKDEILEETKIWIAESVKWKSEMTVLRKKLLEYYDKVDSDSDNYIIEEKNLEVNESLSEISVKPDSVKSEEFKPSGVFISSEWEKDEIFQSTSVFISEEFKSSYMQIKDSDDEETSSDKDLEV